ncbi:MAG: hypothetical protein ACHQ51_16095, partial [Elusimicrobiota bacterium]
SLPFALPPALPAPALAAPVPAAAPAFNPAARLDILGRSLAPELENAARLSAASPESASGLGLSAGDKLSGAFSAAASDGPTPSFTAAPAPARPSFGILKKLGVYGRILRGGGLVVRADGSVVAVKKPLSLRAFDNDDNLIYYRTKIYVRHKVTGEEKAIPTAEFASVRPEIGVTGKYADYELFGKADKDGGSFRDFLDIKDPRVFIKDVNDAVTRSGGAWRGPSWAPFAEALSDRRDAPWVAIVTSRAHRPSSFAKGFRVLKRLGELARVPRKDLIFGVGELSAVQRLLPPDMKTPERKVEVLIELLDLLQSVPIDGDGLHSFSFSDDDLDMITRVRDRLAAEQVSGRWPRVRISLFSTAKDAAWKAVLVAPN